MFSCLTSLSCNVPRYASAETKMNITKIIEKYARTVVEDVDPTWNWLTATMTPRSSASVARNPSSLSSSSRPSISDPCRVGLTTIPPSGAIALPNNVGLRFLPARSPALRRRTIS